MINAWLPERVRAYVDDYLFVLGNARANLRTILLMVAGLDSLGVGLVAGFVAVLAAQLSSSSTLEAQFELFRVLLVIVVVVFVVKTALAYRLTTAISRFSFGQRALLAERFLHGYQQRNWQFYR